MASVNFVFRGMVAPTCDYITITINPPRDFQRERSALFEAQLPELLAEWAPRGARDGFGRKQGPGWDAWLRALADVRERIMCGTLRAVYTRTVAEVAYDRWDEIMEASHAPR